MRSAKSWQRHSQASMTKPAIVIIQARSSSSRLPNKVLKPLAGQPMIWHIVQRARACENAGHVVVATRRSER